MGREANVKKSRLCKSCGEEVYLDAKGLKDHAESCERMKKVGLVMPILVLK